MFHAVTEDYFGGKKVFYPSLVANGLLRKDCPGCGHPISFHFAGDQKFPKTYCSECSKRVESCRNGSVFHIFDNHKTAAFMFLIECFVLTVSAEAARVLSGLDAETARRYTNAVRTIVLDTTKLFYERWEGRLGGRGFVVEIDEVLIVKRKYNVGRILAKGNLIVFGMTELEGGSAVILGTELLEYIRQKELFRATTGAVKGRSGLRQRQARRVVERLESGEDVVEIDDDTYVIALEDDEVPMEVEDEEEREVEEMDGFHFNPELEKKEKALFKKGPKTQPRRSLFFVVPDRKAETLLPIIAKYVRPGTLVFSDGWSSYVQLGKNYMHHVVIHNERFVKYHFDNNTVLKVTTNHIERAWIELRKCVRGLPMDEAEERVLEASYRRYRLSSGNRETDFKNIYEDIAGYCERRQVSTLIEMIPDPPIEDD